MRVLYLASEPRIELAHTAGHTTHIVKTIKGLEEAGHTVHRIIAGERQKARQAKSLFKSLKAKLPLLASLTLRDVYALMHDRMLLRYCYARCREQHFDFLYERATEYHTSGHRLAQKLGILHILEVNAPMEEIITMYGCAPFMVPVLRYCERLAALQADAAIIGSAGMRNYLLELGVSADKIVLLYPTADDIFFQPVRRREALRQQWGLHEKVVVGFVGSMALYQRVDLLLQAAAAVSQVATNIHFLLVGSGKQSEALQGFVREQHLDTCVTFAGRVPYEDVPEYCGVMDMCIIPHATWYASPTKLFEYAAAGKPIIAPRLASIEALIRDGVNGLLVDVCDVHDLATKILTLAKNPTFRQDIGKRLQQDIQNNYTWRHNTQTLISIVESLRKSNETLC
jgi:glycosyltransferase involved in cell wall biosynthesis